MDHHHQSSSTIESTNNTSCQVWQLPPPPKKEEPKEDTAHQHYQQDQQQERDEKGLQYHRVRSIGITTKIDYFETTNIKKENQKIKNSHINISRFGLLQQKKTQATVSIPVDNDPPSLHNSIAENNHYEKRFLLKHQKANIHQPSKQSGNKGITTAGDPPKFKNTCHYNINSHSCVNSTTSYKESFPIDTSLSNTTKKTTTTTTKNTTATTNKSIMNYLFSTLSNIVTNSYKHQQHQEEDPIDDYQDNKRQSTEKYKEEQNQKYTDINDLDQSYCPKPPPKDHFYLNTTLKTTNNVDVPPPFTPNTPPVVVRNNENTSNILSNDDDINNDNTQEGTNCSPSSTIVNHPDNHYNHNTMLLPTFNSHFDLDFKNNGTSFLYIAFDESEDEDASITSKSSSLTAPISSIVSEDDGEEYEPTTTSFEHPQLYNIYSLDPATNVNHSSKHHSFFTNNNNNIDSNTQQNIKMINENGINKLENSRIFLKRENEEQKAQLSSSFSSFSSSDSTITSAKLSNENNSDIIMKQPHQHQHQDNQNNIDSYSKNKKSRKVSFDPDIKVYDFDEWVSKLQTYRLEKLLNERQQDKNQNELQEDNGKPSSNFMKSYQSLKNAFLTTMTNKKSNAQERQEVLEAYYSYPFTFSMGHVTATTTR